MPSFPRLALSTALVLAALGAAAPPAGAGWRSEGPYLGTVVDLAVDPTHPDTVYAATSVGGIFRSDDFGRTWTLPGDEMTSRPVKWVEADPGTAGTVWAGVDNPGEPALWRSRDRGATWDRVTDRVEGGELTDLHPTGVRIAFAPSRPADVWVPSTNLHYRSRDGGRSWSDFRVPGQDAYAVAVDPRNPDVVYAGGRGTGHQLSRSDDGGKSWKPVGRGLAEASIRSLLVDPRQPDRIYAVAGFCDLWRSSDRGETFTELPTPAGPTDDCHRLVFDPAGAGRLWVASEAGLFRSGDGGTTWQRSEQGTGRYLVHSIAFDPRDASRALAASAGGGVYRSDDGGARWSPSVEGLAAGWIEALHGSPASPALFAQTTVGLFRRDGGRGWSELGTPFEADGGAVELSGFLFDHAAAAVVWAFDGGHAWRSADSGGRWQELEQEEPSLRQMMKGNLERAQFQSLAQDPGDARVLYAGAWSNDEPGNAVFKSTDGGKSWKSAGAGVPNDDVERLVAASPGAVLAWVAGHGLFRTADGGRSWAAAGSGLAGEKLRALAVDPTRPTRVFAATEAGLFRSLDQGATFVRLGGALAEEDIEAVVVAPDGKVFAGSFHGVFQSADGGDGWAAFGDTLPNSDVRALAVAGPAPARLYAGTAGGSVWSIELP